MSDITQLKNNFEKSLYTELYHFDNNPHTIVINKISEEMFVKKELSTYQIDVFEYLKEHSNPHIPSIHTYWEEDGKLIVIEEYVQGTTLDTYLVENNPSLERREKILLDILDGVSFLHQATPPIIHRDLKASNIMITNDDEVKILDYDAAKNYQEGSARDTVLMGTPGNAAPEQYGFAQSDERTDIYALGVLMKEMFPNEKAYLQIANKATEIDPKNRFSTIDELKTSIQTKKVTTGLWPLPGFRTHNKWHALIAIATTIIVVPTIFTIPYTSNDVPSTGIAYWIDVIMVFCMYISIVDLYTDWTHIFSNFFMLKSSNQVIKILGYALLTIVIFCFYSFLAGILEYIFV